MSVWTKVQTKVLEKNVDMEIFKESMKDLEITLDYNVKEVKNSFGKSQVDAGLRYQGELRALGIARTASGGIELIGDTWRSGIVGDKQANALVNMMSQAYQKNKLKKELELAGWEVKPVQVGNQVKLEISQW